MSTSVGIRRVGLWECGSVGAWVNGQMVDGWISGGGRVGGCVGGAWTMGTKEGYVEG